MAPARRAPGVGTRDDPGWVGDAVRAQPVAADHRPRCRHPYEDTSSRWGFNPHTWTLHTQVEVEVEVETVTSGMDCHVVTAAGTAVASQTTRPAATADVWSENRTRRRLSIWAMTNTTRPAGLGEQPRNGSLTEAVADRGRRGRAGRPVGPQRQLRWRRSPRLGPTLLDGFNDSWRMSRAAWTGTRSRSASRCAVPDDPGAILLLPSCCCSETLVAPRTLRAPVRNSGPVTGWWVPATAAASLRPSWPRSWCKPRPLRTWCVTQRCGLILRVGLTYCTAKRPRAWQSR